MFFNGWDAIIRTIVVGVIAYVGLIFFLRISGKRTLSKMNAFDLVVTVSLGSTLATILLSKSVSLAEGLLALALLITLQYLVAWLSVRSKSISNLVKSEPSLLFYDGQFLQEVMKHQRVTEAEVRSAIRAQGVSRVETVLAVVLETDGSFTVLPDHSEKEATALNRVKRS